MNEVDFKFIKNVTFPNQYKLLEIQKCYKIALMSTFDIQVKLILESVVEKIPYFFITNHFKLFSRIS